MVLFNRSIWLTTLLGLFSVAVIAQERKVDFYEPGKRATSFYVELGGPGFISANYDFRFGETRNGIGARFGIGYFSMDDESYLTVPVQLNYLLGKDGNYFEMGIGASYVRYAYDDYSWLGGETEQVKHVTENQVMGSLIFGYRRQPRDGGFTFRAGLSPILIDGNFIPYLPYMSFGYSF
ncbi:hypothetical protein [Parapedobacter soli]|uniref:hypothetical protein n=1 Tax=Parapedobacter soli TaxID=416955 RepID=UPI0021CA2F3F|nr:hypothetical protein [Parapedobacter soli]